MVDFPCFGEAQLIGDGGEDLDNCKRSFTFRGELWVCDRMLEISGL